MAAPPPLSNHAPVGDLLENPHQLRVLSLNIWGLPDILGAWLHTYPHKVAPREERVQRIAEAFQHYDVIALQEVWLPADRQSLVQIAASFGIRYSHYFRAGMVGSGLFVLSRFPISSPRFYCYTINGKPQRLHHGDWHASKGLAHCQLLLDSLTNLVVDCYVTHLVSQYSSLDDEYEAQRVLQAFELSDIIENSRASPYVLLCGDFNSRPGSVIYDILAHYGCLKDSYAELHPNESEQDGATHMIDVFMADPPKRIDFVFYRQARSSPGLPGDRLQPVRSSIELKPQEQNKFFIYSDHFAVCSDFVLKPDAPHSAPLPRRRSSVKEALTHSASQPIAALDYRSHATMEPEANEEALAAVYHRARALLEAGIARNDRDLKRHVIRGVLCLVLVPCLFLLLSGFGVLQAVVSCILGLAAVLELSYAMFFKRVEIAVLRSAMTRWLPAER
jgi:sphingomyelin phosphodiesterase 2